MSFYNTSKRALFKYQINDNYKLKMMLKLITSGININDY